MKLNETLNKVFELNEHIKHFLLEIGYNAELLEVDKSNPDENFYSDEFWLLADSLAEISAQIKYLNSPVVAEGTISYKNRHFFIDNVPVETDTVIEILNHNSWHKCYVYEFGNAQEIGDFSVEELKNKKARRREQLFCTAE